MGGKWTGSEGAPVFGGEDGTARTFLLASAKWGQMMKQRTGVEDTL